jgi:hypothetical protein
MRTLWTFGDSYTADYFIPHQGQYLDKNNYEKYESPDKPDDR